MFPQVVEQLRHGASLDHLLLYEFFYFTVSLVSPLERILLSEFFSRVFPRFFF